MSKSFEEYISGNADKRLEYFLNTLSATNRTPEYYVNWEKVNRETNKYELELNTLNFLIGKENIFDESVKLFENQPSLLKAVPSLLAIRDRQIDVLSVNETDDMDFYKLDFENTEVNEIKEYVEFMEKSGLLEFLQNDANRSLVDYVYGVEAGLDSNGRKNRSGTTMETILSRSVDKVAKDLGLHHMSQATSQYIFENWGVHVPVDKSKRLFDEAVFDPETKKVWIIETNYYGGGGSKLKAVSGEFITLHEFVEGSKDNVTFVWVTDGKGWKTVHLPLLEAFNHITNVFNLNMLQEDYLYKLFK